MFNDWLTLFPLPVPYYRVFLRESGMWGVTGLKSDVQAYHEDFDAALNSAKALNSRLTANGSRRTVRRRGR